MMGASNSLNLHYKVRVMKEAPGPSVSEMIYLMYLKYLNIELIISLHS